MTILTEHEHNRVRKEGQVNYLDRIQWVKDNDELITSIVTNLGGYKLLRLRKMHAMGETDD